jgi:hypothetical protein
LKNNKTFSCTEISLYLVYNLFDITGPDYAASDGRMVVNNELQRMWKETVMAYFELPS